MKEQSKLKPGQSIIGGIVALSFSIWLIIIPPLAIIVAIAGLIMILNGIIGAVNNKINSKKAPLKTNDK